jgi:glucokinase
MSIYIAIDIGGTRMRAAAYPAEGFKPIHIERIASQAPGSTPQEKLVQLIQDVCPTGEKISSIGVAAPGPINPKAGVVYHAPNIAELRYFPLVEFLEEQIRVPVFLDNDANLATVGEWKAGAAIGHNHLVYLTISTGIGGGVISDGQLLHGVQGMAAELGHITVLPEGPLCSCGKQGHLEALASGPSITRWTEAEIQNSTVSSLQGNDKISAKTIAQAAQQGDKLALAAFQRAGYYVGIALANFLHTFNPSMIVFGGGVSRSGDLLLEPVKESLRDHIFDPKYLENFIVTTAQLGDDAGLIGALILARNAINK